MILMGIPVMQLDWRHFTSSAPHLQKVMRDKPIMKLINENFETLYSLLAHKIRSMPPTPTCSGLAQVGRQWHAYESDPGGSSDRLEVHVSKQNGQIFIALVCDKGCGM